MSTPRERISYGTGRETLLAAAVQVASEKGLAGLTYREVAREAGVAHSLVAHHFGTRHNLVKETMEYAVQVGSQTIHFTGEDLGGLAEDLDVLVRDTPGLQAFQIELAIKARGDDDLNAAAQSMYDQYLGLLRDDLEELGLGSDPAVARLVMATIDGLVIQQLVYDSPEMTRESMELLRNFIGQLRETQNVKHHLEPVHPAEGNEQHDRKHHRHRLSAGHRSSNRREIIG